MQPEITREWLAEQLALCERAAVGDWEEFFDYERAAKEHYPAVLRKLMEAMDETPIDEAWLRETTDFGDSSGLRDLKRFELCGDDVRLLAHACEGPRCWRWDLWIGKRLIKENPTRAAVLALLVGVGAKGG